MQKTDWLTKSVVLCLGCACALSVLAYPTKAELDKAQKLVNEIMSSDVAAFNAKNKSAAEVAKAALGYVDEAQSEAAKLLLLKGAFFYQMRSDDYDGAAATIGRIRSEISNVPDKEVVDMLSGELRRVQRKHCGLLYDLLSRMQNRARYAQEARSIRQKIKANPADKKLQGQLGERYAMLGDWGAAIKAFAAGDGKRATIAQWEQKYPETGITELTTAKVADFWWDAAADGNEDLKSACRIHAANWYRKAIENNALPGLKKTLAEKRIAEVEKDNSTAQEQSNLPNAAPTVLKNSLKIPMGRGIVMELVPCPAGTFEMGYAHRQDPNDLNNAHKVKISRKFWMGRFEVTLNQWCVLMPSVALDPMATALGGMKAPVSNVSPEEMDDFCDRMNKKYGRMLPKGYVFRLPTEAEWEYACRADAQPGTPYGKPNGLTKEEGLSIAIRPSEKADVLRKAGVVFDEKQAWKISGMIGGCKKPNGWGIYDMVGNVDEFVLDRLPIVLPDGQKQQWGATPKGLVYMDATDPLAWTADDKVCRIIRNNISNSMGWAGAKKAFPDKARIPCVGFRVVAGPDLVRERQLASRTADAVIPDKKAIEPSSSPALSSAKQSVPQPPPRTLKLGRGVDIEFVGCPAGSFMMGNKFINKPCSIWMYHKVNFTRPFWLSKYKVTHGMWNAYKKVTLTKEDQVLGGMMRAHFTKTDEAEAFCEWLTKRFRSNLPPGYVVRLPTNAEWEYAYRANVTDETDPYVRLWPKKPMEIDDSSIMVSWEKDILSKLNAAGVKFDAARVFGTAVGTKRPNAWGLYDIVGNGSEWLLDRVDCGLLKNVKGESLAVVPGYPNWFDQDAVRIEETETDPLWWCTGEQARNLRRGSGGLSSGRYIGHPSILNLNFGLNPYPFRLCIGPDLVKEKGLKK